MKKNLYRGKREDTQEWVEGIYFEKYGESYIINLIFSLKLEIFKVFHFL